MFFYPGLEMVSLKVITIIPAYNEELSIAGVIGRIRQEVPEAEILVVNDGSKDNTSKVAAGEGVKVVSLPFNLGIGGAMQTGYIYARNNGFDIAVQVDGDGQHDPSYIPGLILPVARDEADMVIGSRYVNKTSYKSSFSRRTGMVFFSYLVSLLTGQKVNDTTSGFRVVNRKVIEYFSDHYPLDYPEVDVLVKLHRKHFRIMEMPVEMKERKAGHSSITPLKSVYYMIKVSISLLIGAIKASD